jgi:hypothetical protein
MDEPAKRFVELVGDDGSQQNVGLKQYKVVPPSYKLVYKPHEYYRYITYKP